MLRPGEMPGRTVAVAFLKTRDPIVRRLAEVVLALHLHALLLAERTAREQGHQGRPKPETGSESEWVVAMLFS